jgi:hypothetical protein
VDLLALAVNLNLFPQDQLIWMYAQAVPSQQNAYIVGGHGTPTSMYGPDSQPLTAQEVADMIESDMGYQPGELVVLGSCNTGNDNNTYDGSQTFAQQLADILGAPVVAPTDFAWYTNKGSLFTANMTIPTPATGYTQDELNSGPSLLVPGQWITYLPTQTLGQ